MDLLVVGAGEMGRWVARVVREDDQGERKGDGRGDDQAAERIAFADADSEAAARAAATLGGPRVETVVNDPDAVDPFDAVCVAVPIPAAPAAIETWAPIAERAILDVTGTMAEPVAAMREHAEGLEHASFHPLFAPENEPGSVAAVTENRGPLVDRLTTALQDRDNEVFETTVAEHDRAMETVQARTHAAVLAFGLAAEPVDERFHTPVSAPLADLVEQVTDGEARVYADIQDAFDGAEDVAVAAERIAEAGGDARAFAALFEDAAGDGRVDET